VNCQNSIVRSIRAGPVGCGVFDQSGHLTAGETIKIAIIGCGNANRCDDGVGVEVVRLLKEREDFVRDERVLLLDAGTDGMAVMFAARGCTSLFIVDACRSNSAPGTLFEVPGTAIAAQKPHTFNLHDFRWDHALFAGRQIYSDDFPCDVTAFLIEAFNVDYGVGLSDNVRIGAERVAGKIEDRVRARLSASAGIGRAQ
jgi:hydrogenase maturation protease